MTRQSKTTCFGVLLGILYYHRRHPLLTKTSCFTFVLGGPYYYRKGENDSYSLFLLFIIMLILI